MASASKRARKPNFSEKESMRLLELVNINIDQLNQTSNKLRYNAAKKATWQHIAAEVSMVSLVQRNEDECRKKWRDLKRAVSAYRTHFRGTGGGPPQPEPPFYELIIKILGDSVEGIQVQTPDPWDNSVPVFLKAEETTVVELDNVLGDVRSSTPEKANDEVGNDNADIPLEEPSPVFVTSHVPESVPKTANYGKSIAKAISGKGKFKKRAAAKASSDGDPDLWDEWLRAQIDYYKIKAELAKEQLLQLRGKPAE